MEKTNYIANNPINNASTSTTTTSFSSSLTSPSSSVPPPTDAFFDLSTPANNDVNFDLTVLGSSGGPIDGRTCSYLVKTSNISYADIVSQDLPGRLICIDAGCGIAGINDIILEENRHLFGNNSNLEYDSQSNIKPITKATSDLQKHSYSYPPVPSSVSHSSSSTNVSQSRDISSQSSENPIKLMKNQIKSNSFRNLLKRNFSKFGDDCNFLFGNKTANSQNFDNLQVMIEKSYNQNFLLRSYEDSMHITLYTNCPLRIFDLDCKKLNLSSYQLTMKILHNVTEYLITHPHLDHISGLVINSAGFVNKVRAKKVYGSEFTINALKNYVFNGIIWPNLQCDVNGSFLRLMSFESSSEPNTITNAVSCTLQQDTNKHSDNVVYLNENYHVKPFSVNHGVISDGSSLQHGDAVYQSSTYLIKSLQSNKFILIFGDLETSGKNREIWDNAASLVLFNKLSGIIIECSTYNVPVNTPLFGHLTPSHLYNELTYLSNKVLSLYESSTPSQQQFFNQTNFNVNRPLQNLKILISHVKEDASSGKDPRKIILSQLTALNEKYQLGCSFTIAFPGLTYSL